MPFAAPIIAKPREAGRNAIPGKESVTHAIDAANLARNLFALIPMPMAVLDSNATIVLANAAFRSVFPTETTVRDVRHQDVEVDGECYDFEMMPLANGLSLFLGREVTEERRLRARLEKLEGHAALGRLFPIVARELRTPLDMVAVGVESLASPGVSGRRMAAPVTLGHELAKMFRMLDGMSDLAADASFAREAVDFADCLRNAMACSDLPASATCSIPDQLPHVLGVRAYLEHVLSTVLSSARDRAMIGDEGSVELRVSTPESAVCIEVRVTGTSCDSGGGGGENTAGLAVAKEVARRLGGRLDVGSGPDFEVVVEFPALRASAGMAARVRAVHGEALVGKTIMVVDDEVVITSLIEEFLSRCGARVEMFNSSSEAYARLAGNARYDTIICDQRMPGVSGESLYRRVETLDPGQARRFVFITGNALDDEARRFFSRTRTRYILKPFSLNDLYTVVSTAIEPHPIMN